MAHDIKPNTKYGLATVRLALTETNGDAIADGLSNLLLPEIGEGFIADYMFTGTDRPVLVESSSEAEEGELFNNEAEPVQYGKQVLIVEITQNGSDVAVFLNGEYVISADPGCGDSTETVYEVAKSLAGIHKVCIQHIEHAPDNDEWQWSEVEKHLHDVHVLESPIDVNSEDVYAVCIEDPNYEESWHVVKSRTKLSALDEDKLRSVLSERLCIGQEDRVYVGCLPSMPVLNLDGKDGGAQ